MADKKKTRAQIIRRLTSLSIAELSAVFAEHYNGSPFSASPSQNARAAELCAKRCVGASWPVPDEFVKVVAKERVKVRESEAKWANYRARTIAVQALHDAVPASAKETRQKFPAAGEPQVVVLPTWLQRFDRWCAKCASEIAPVSFADVAGCSEVEYEETVLAEYLETVDEIIAEYNAEQAEQAKAS